MNDLYPAHSGKVILASKKGKNEPKIAKNSSVEEVKKIEPFWLLPGKSEPRSDCGEIKVLYCRNCENYFIGTHRCGERYCPNCYKIWAKRETYIATNRILNHRKRKQRIVHTIFSPPSPIPPLDVIEYRELRKEAEKLAKQCGFEGFCIIYHPYREEKDKVFDVEGQHFHVVGLLRGWQLSGDVIYRDSGWVMKTTTHKDYHREKKSIAITNKQLLLKVIYYCLEHCGFRKDIHSIVWVGTLAYRRKNDRKNEEITIVCEEPNLRVRCPFCNSPDVYYVSKQDWRFHGTNLLDKIQQYLMENSKTKLLVFDVP